MESVYILAIETSCDDTSIAISHDDKILSNVVLSSSNSHKRYGGIVPEIASRSHQSNLVKAFRLAISKAKIDVNKITHVVYTAMPGLPGSLHMGKVFAKSIASLLNVPLIPINHMYGHIYSFGINSVKRIKYPFISLVVSGGHTTIYLVNSIKNIKVLNETVDDAIGEALDKVGRILGFSYPGGISIDQAFNSKKMNIKMIHHFPPTDSFSFSGIKTHILNLLNQSKMKKQIIDKVAVASSLLEWVVEEIMIKLRYYSGKYPEVKFVTSGGGVSANKLLRKEIKNLNKPVLLPEIEYTGDNAAMIALYAYLLIND